MKPTTPSIGVYVTLAELIRFQHRTRGVFSFLPCQPVHSLLSGRHASRIRGRGKAVSVFVGALVTLGSTAAVGSGVARRRSGGRKYV